MARMAKQRPIDKNHLSDDEAAKIREAIHQHESNQARIADMVGLNPSHFTRILNGSYSLSREHSFRIYDCLGREKSLEFLVHLVPCRESTVSPNHTDNYTPLLAELTRKMTDTLPSLGLSQRLQMLGELAATLEKYAPPK